MVREHLIELRGKRSRREVATALGITKQMLGAVERGDRTPSLALASKISQFYRVPMDAIFGSNMDGPSGREEALGNAG